MEQVPLPQPETNKVEQLRELVREIPDVFFILTGAMKENKDNAKSTLKPYESGAFIDPDQNSGLVTGGKDRMLAAAELHVAFPQSHVVPMSKTRDERPTYASVMRKELEAKGVNPDVIIEELESVDTVTELKEAARISEAKGWKEIVFLSSDYHLPRVNALLNHIENFADTVEEEEVLARFTEAIRLGRVKVQFIGSGDVLKIRSPHYEQLFAKLDQNEGMQQRIALEKKALAQIEAGTYSGRSLTKKINSAK